MNQLGSAPKLLNDGIFKAAGADDMRIGVDISRKIGLGSFLCALEIALFHAPGAWAKLTPLTVELYRTILPLTQAALAFFFAVSGFLVADKVLNYGFYIKVVVKRMRTLLIPFILWNLIFLGCVLLMIRALRGTEELYGFISLMPGGSERWLEPDMMAFMRNCPNPVLWFIRTLFVLIVLSPLFAHGIRYFEVYFLVLLGIGVLVVETFHVSIPLATLIQPRAVFYFSLGIWWRWKKEDILRGPFSSWMSIAMVIVGYALSFCSPIGYFLLMVGYVGVLPELSSGRWLQTFAFPLYMMHYPMVWTFLFLNARFGFVKTGTVAWVISTGVFAAMSSLFAVSILRRLSPKVCGILFGGR